MNPMTMRLLRGLVPRDAEPGTDGAAPAPAGDGGAKDGGAAEPAKTAEPKSLLDGDDRPDGGAKDGAKDGGEGKSAAPAKPKSLLDDEPEKPAEGAKDGGKPAPTEEEIAEWCRGVPALDLGDGVKWDDDALKAMAPSLMSLPKEASGKVISAYAEYTKEVARRQAVAADAFNAGLIRQCEERFGADLRKVASYAKKGGAAIFGDALWGQMKTVPQFANNPDVMERLAAYGRSIATDGGKVTPDEGRGGEDRSDVIKRMYGGVKV